MLKKNITTDIPPGSVLSTPIVGIYKHYGILTESGTVISGSKRMKIVVEETLGDFAPSGYFRKEMFSTNVLPAEIISRARQRLGEPWDLLSNNCEHFVRTVLGQPKISSQVRLTGLFLVGGLIVKGLARAKPGMASPVP